MLSFTCYAQVALHKRSAACRRGEVYALCPYLYIVTDPDAY